MKSIVIIGKKIGAVFIKSKKWLRQKLNSIENKQFK